MTCIINRDLKKVPLLPWTDETQELFVTIWGDTIIRWNTGKIPRVKQSNDNKKDLAHDITD